VARDLFTVPTATFRGWYCFFVIEHRRRRILHFNVTRHPSSDWIVQQLRETFAEAAPYRYAILDRDSIFNADVIAFLKATGRQPKRTSVQAPWQNGTAERWIGSCRREILDPVIPLNEEHLGRLMRDYVHDHQEDRVHDSLKKDTPNRRPVEPKPAPDATLISLPRLGGLHHRYAWCRRPATIPTERRQLKAKNWRIRKTPSAIGSFAEGRASEVLNHPYIAVFASSPKREVFAVGGRQGDIKPMLHAPAQ